MTISRSASLRSSILRLSLWGLSVAGLCLLGLGAAAPAEAQESTFEWPRSSPKAEVHQRVATTDIQLTYSRPSARGRTIFGGLVPYDRVWRTGADSATQITFSTPVSVGDQALEAGTYELFTIPSKDAWTVIFHEHKSQWGSYAYDPANDVARVTVEPVRLEHPVETLTLSVDHLASSSAVLNIAWESVRVPVEIGIDVRQTVLPHFEEALKGEGDRPYYRAAMFFFENDLDIDRAVELMQKALEARPDSFPMLYRLALMLEKKGDTAGAIAAVERSLESTAKIEGEELRDEYTRLNNTLLERLRAQ